MSPDDVIALRRTMSGFDYGDALPAATILATADWLAYVTAMADAIPSGPQIEWPTEEDVRWAWPDGVLIVFAHPVSTEHTIVSHGVGVDGEVVADVPHYETQTMQAIAIGPATVVGLRGPHGEAVVRADGAATVTARGTYFIGVDLADICTGWLTFGAGRTAAENLDNVGGVARFLLAVVTALGHRASTMSAPAGSRAERRRAEREVPGLRVIDLASGATTESCGGGTVEWSRRWVVRGHPRMQAYGPGRTLRKLIWVDPFVKGPADKPFDDRPTVWTT